MNGQGIDGYIESGITDQRIHFYTGVTGLASGTTIRKMRGTGASAPWAGSVDIVEDATVVGAYRILVGEETTVTSGKTTEMLTLFLTNATLGGQKITLTIMLYNQLSVNVKAMNGTSVIGAGASINKWRG